MMDFLGELIYGNIVGSIMRFIVICLKMIFEIVFEAFLGEIIRFVGVCFLYTAGRLLAVFKPRKIVYSFNDLWTMDYDKGDDYKLMMEKTGQRMAGFMVIGVIMTLCFVL